MIRGNERLLIVFEADLFKVFDKGMVDVRKWIEALLEWEGT